MESAVDLALLGLLLGVAGAVAALHNLVAAAMLSGIYSLLAAALFVLMDAVDVAFTEAVVGAGITTVLFLATLAQTARQEKVPVRLQLAPIAVTAITAAALLYGTADMPGFGDPAAPIHHHVVPRYLEEAPAATSVPNVVTAVLASYRGYDTLGEVTVIFTAG
ncbi:MAG: DUF4040 domain-containing protein, partial [Alphaproteobacteria bacterium]|nr:DUF4040 domain-containing protein [Alphaproteobacteria bacterium]